MQCLIVLKGPEPLLGGTVLSMQDWLMADEDQTLQFTERSEPLVRLQGVKVRPCRCSNVSPAAHRHSLPTTSARRFALA